MRLEMLAAMCKEDSRLAVDTCEYGRDPSAKTFETMETIQEKYPEAELYFVAGGDKLAVIPRWHRKEEFLQRFRLLVTRREGTSPESVIEKQPFLKQHADAFVLLAEPEGIENISSTRVRQPSEGRR